MNFDRVPVIGKYFFVDCDIFNQNLSVGCRDRVHVRYTCKCGNTT